MNETAFEGYPSVVHADRFLVNWAEWYTQARYRSADIALRYRTREVAYGEHAEQAMHVLYPDVPTRSCVVFVHGGGLKEGHPALFRYLGDTLLEHGIAFATIGYRLGENAPQTAPRDLKRALGELQRIVSDDGIDALTLIGHSAGAAVIARLLFDDRRSSASLDTRLHGVVLISGVYSTTHGIAGITTIDDNESGQPVLLGVGPLTVPPMLLAASAYEPNRRADDPTLYRQETEHLAAALAGAGVAAETIWLVGDHTQTAAELIRHDSPMTRWILEHHLGQEG